MENNKNLPNRIKILLAYLNENLSGSNEAVSLTLLSAVAGENILMLGPSGLDKIEVVRCIASAFSDFYKNGHNPCFEYFLNESSAPDDLRIADKSIVFLDDIWAASPSVLNRLLEILNDSSFFVAAGSKEADPYKAAEEKRFDALRECFALHVNVNAASSDETFFKFVQNANCRKPDEAQSAALIRSDDMKSWQPKIDKIELSTDAKNLISEIRRKCFDYYVSLFRWKKIIRILKTCAFLNGRDKIDLADCLLVDYAIPNRIVEGILKQKVIDGKLDSRQHIQYKENIFTQQKYLKILSNSVADLKSGKEHLTDL